MLTSSPDGIPVLEPRNLVRRRFVMALGVMAVIGLIALLLSGQGSNDRILGSGSTAAQPLIQRLSVDFQRARSGDEDWVSGSSGVDYEAVGSLGGVMRLADPEVDFAIADYPLSPNLLSDLDAAQFPIMIGSISPVYNLGPKDGPSLRFSAATLAGIFDGRITNWSDPAIAAENPGIGLPQTAISVVRRSDGSGSTFNFSTYLSRGDEGWKARYGAATTLKWTAGAGVKGSSEMAKAVAATPGSIGYLETGQARRAGLSIGAVRNDSGNYVTATQTGIASASRGIALAGTADRSGLSAPDAYPLASVFYAVMKRRNASSSDTQRTLRLFSFLFDQGGKATRTLGYLPLSAEEIQGVRKLWARDLGSSESISAN